MGEKKKFEINVNAKENAQNVAEEVVEKEDMPKIENDVPAEETEAEKILGILNDTVIDTSKPKVTIEVKAKESTAETVMEELKNDTEEVETIEAEQVEAAELDGNTSEDVSNIAKDIAGEATNLLNNLKDYITGNKFDDKCQKTEEKTGIKKEIIKNAFVKNILRAIADTLGLVITTGGNIILSAVAFIEKLIGSAVNFTQDVLLKLINVLTLNCGTK